LSRRCKTWSLSFSANSSGASNAITEQLKMKKLAQSGGGTIHVSVKILFAFCHQQSSSQESIAGFGHTVPRRAERT